jgi:hypothetical protein
MTHDQTTEALTDLETIRVTSEPRMAAPGRALEDRPFPADYARPHHARRWLKTLEVRRLSLDSRDELIAG